MYFLHTTIYYYMYLGWKLHYSIKWQIVQIIKSLNTNFPPKVRTRTQEVMGTSAQAAEKSDQLPEGNIKRCYIQALKQSITANIASSSFVLVIDN